MTPIHELLNRIRWDPEFGKADFKVGYYDRLEDKIIVVPFQEIGFEEGNRFSVQVWNEGEMHTVPLHRIREVYRNGALIWQR